MLTQGLMQEGVFAAPPSLKTQGPLADSAVSRRRPVDAWEASMRIPRGTYWSALTGFVLVFAPLAPAVAQEPGEFERAEDELRILEASRELSSVLRDIKGHLRVSDNMAQFLAQGDEADERSGKYLLRRSFKLLEKLSAEVAPVPRAGARLLSGRDKARRGVAAADLLLTMARAIEEAESSSGRQKLLDLKAVFGHAETLLPMISFFGEGLALNPVIAAYFVVMREAIENIAESAEIIERERDMRNAALRMVRDAIGVDYGQESVLDELEARLQREIEERRDKIQQLKARELAPMFTDVDAAERACYRQLGLDWSAVDDLRTSVRNARFAVWRAWESMNSLKNDVIPGLDVDIQFAQDELEDLRIRRRLPASSQDYAALDARIAMEQSAIGRLRQRIAAAEAEVERLGGAPLRAAQTQYEEARGAFQRYGDCVRKHVELAQEADLKFLDDYFPGYGASYWDFAERQAILDRIATPDATRGALFRADVEVAARANSSSGGSGKAIGFELGAGDLLTVRVDPGDTWSAGDDQPHSRESNADGLQQNYGLHLSGNLSAPFGSLVGRIGSGPFFVIGTSFEAEVKESGPLLLYYWDSDAFNNSGSVTAVIGVSRAGPPD